MPRASGRPARERKSVDKFVVEDSRHRDTAVDVKQGSGTPLKDIPNVTFKLAKLPRTDRLLAMLHSLLYNKRAKMNVVKANIQEFSGFVYGENKEKERSKVRDKLELYTKEGLSQLLDLFDLPTLGKKEEQVARVLEFLDSPRQVSSVDLAKKEEKAAQKRPAKAAKSKTPKLEIEHGSGLKKKRKAEGLSKKEEEELGKEIEQEEEVDKEELEEEEVEDKEDDLNEEDNEEEEDDAKERKEKKRKTKVKAPSSKPKKPSTAPVTPSKATGRGGASGGQKKMPSDTQLRKKVAEILKSADLGQLSLKKVREELSSHFAINVDPKKAFIKKVVEELMPEDYDEDDDKEDRGATADKEAPALGNLKTDNEEATDGPVTGEEAKASKDDEESKKDKQEEGHDEKVDAALAVAKNEPGKGERPLEHLEAADNKLKADGKDQGEEDVGKQVEEHTHQGT
eukprot:SM000037S13582  [mRNA]  locus=s37:792901:796703:+ [translate_table: standard]